jgi:FkbM family methyltransferase
MDVLNNSILRNLNQKIYIVAVKIARRVLYDGPLHKSGVFNDFYKTWTDRINTFEEKPIKYKNADFFIPKEDITILPTLITGDYESFEIEKFTQTLNEDDIVFDIGANIGIYSVLISRNLSSAGKVICFEPAPNNFDFLIRNLKANNCDNAKPEMLALGSEVKKVKFYLSEESIGSHSVIGKGKNIIEADQTTIDVWCEQNSLYPDVMKIDVEGYESHVLRGAKETMKKVRYFMMEYIPPRIISEQINANDWEALIKTLENNFEFFYLLRKNRVEEISISNLLECKYGNLISSKKRLDI